MLTEPCKHSLQFRCVSCGAQGCDENECPNQVVLDSSNPWNPNFEHGTDTCLKCGAKAATSAGDDQFIRLR